MKLAVRLGLSLGMLALCAWLVWPNAATRAQVGDVMKGLELATFAPYLLAYVALLAVLQVCRSLRWNNLLAPLNVRVPPGPLLAISAVGFMAIVALPARVGEFVRPGLLRQRGGVSASAALGTVAIERIVDGLLISLFVFGALFSLRGPDAPGWMMPTAYTALGVFVAALLFVVFAMWRAQQTIAFCIRLTLLPQLAPRLATLIETKLLDMVRGFVVLRDRRNMTVFVLWSLAYWGANGLSVWVLAHAFDLDLSVVGGFATMGVVGVGMMLPNSPGMVGQFQWFMLLGLSLYLGPGVLDESNAAAFAFANLHYVLQVGWYLLCGAIGLATPWVSVHDLRAASSGRKLASDAITE